MKSKVVSFTAALLIALANAGIVSYADSMTEETRADENVEPAVSAVSEEGHTAETVDSSVVQTSDSIAESTEMTTSSYYYSESSESDTYSSLLDSSYTDSTAENDSSSSDDSSSEDENDQIKSDVSGYTTEDLIKIMTDFTSENAGSVTINKNGEVFITERDTPDYDNDSYYDTKGNASLIKSEQIIYNSTDMQFIAVTTKDGHVFYVLINYSARDGQDNVYFLNKVDDYDLYALLYAGTGEDGADPDFTPRDALNAAENLNGNNTKTKKAVSSKTETADETEEYDTYESDSEVTEEKQSKPNTLPIVVGIAAVGVIGFYAYKNVIKKGGGSKKKAEFDDDDFDDDFDKDE